MDYQSINLFHVKQIPRLDKAAFFLPLLRSNLSVSLSIQTCGSEVLLFSKFRNIVSIFIMASI